MSREPRGTDHLETPGRLPGDIEKHPIPGDTPVTQGDGAVGKEEARGAAAPAPEDPGFPIPAALDGVGNSRSRPTPSPPPGKGGGFPTAGEPTASPPGEAVPWGTLLADGETVARYRSHVLRRGPDECWWWTHSLSDTAHGTFRAGARSRGTSRVVLAHLYGYRLVHGAGAIPRGWVVRHTCDEPPCQNPAHWLLGTRADNNADAVSRRRLAGHALADVRGAFGRARAVQDAIAAAGPGEVEEAIAAALAAGNPSGGHQDALF